MANPVLVEALRGPAVESLHRGSIAVLDADAGVLLALGETQRPVYPRSAVKALQALPLVESGAANRLGLDDAELALACASHRGEPRHTQAVAGVLAKAGLDADALECGIHWPYDEAAARALAAQGRQPSALHNNCSGKHAGFLCLACALGGDGDVRAFARGYVEREHPVMRAVTAALQATTGWDLAATPQGIDGCSIPTYAIPLHHLALAFGRLGTGQGLAPGQARAAQRLRKAVAHEPFFVAGTDRFDTHVMERLGERVFCKGGAEGMYCAALPERGLGVAIKMDDGNTARAAEVVMAAAVEALVPLGDEDRAFMHGLADVTLRNWKGIEVGAVRATDALRRALAPIGAAAGASAEWR